MSDEKSAQAENVELTFKDLLDNLVIEAVQSVSQEYGIPGTLPAEAPIVEYVAARDTLIAQQAARIAALEARQITPAPVGHKDEYGTVYFGDREFDGWVARLGHGCVRRGDDRICFTDAQEMKDFAAILLGMIEVSEKNGA